jgi:hypothetical protein
VQEETMQLDRTVLAGAAGLIIGVLVGLAVSASGRSALKAQLAAQEEARLAKLETAIGSVDVRVGELGTRLGDVEGALAALGESQSGRMTSLGERLDSIGSDVSAALAERLEKLRTEVTALAPGEAPPTGSGAGTAIAVGATGVLADGKLRVFVSTLDAAAGTARVALNGTETVELKMSEPVRAGDCQVTLTGIGDGTATIDAGC